MLSKSSKYGIRATLYVAVHADENQKVSPDDIAKGIGVPAPFLAKILQLLTKRNLLTSVRGRNGGFYLTEMQKMNTLIAVVDAIDGLDSLHACVLGLANCNNDFPCPFHGTFSEVKKGFIDELTFKTISSISKNIAEGETVIGLY